MSELEQNKEIARCFTKAFAAGDTVALKELVAEDVVDHNPRPGQTPGRHALMDAVEQWTNSERVGQASGSRSLPRSESTA